MGWHFFYGKNCWKIHYLVKNFQKPMFFVKFFNQNQSINLRFWFQLGSVQIHFFCPFLLSYIYILHCARMHTVAYVWDHVKNFQRTFTLVHFWKLVHLLVFKLRRLISAKYLRKSVREFTDGLDLRLCCRTHTLSSAYRIWRMHFSTLLESHYV